MATIVEHGKTWEGFPYVSIVVEGYAFPADLDHYLIGIDPPNYPVPAIQYNVKVHPLDTDEPWFYWSVTWERLNEYEPILCAIVDMNFDRAMDLGHPFCEFHQF